MDPREKRMTENETLFREVNERVEDTVERFHDAGNVSAVEFFCECANPDCTFRISLARSEREPAGAAAVA